MSAQSLAESGGQDSPHPLVCALARTPTHGYAVDHLSRFDLRAERYDVNLRRCVRPERAEDLGVGAYVDVTDTDWRKSAARGGDPRPTRERSSESVQTFTHAG